MHPRHLLTLGLLATLAVYWPGLGGPFLLDDEPNLGLIRRWLAGQGSWHDAVFGTGSGLLHRPLAMATLAANAWFGGMSPVLFKLVNLILHLGTGMLVFRLVQLLCSQDRRLAPHAVAISSLVAVFWLLHPLHVSTVLYVVQRMAQLSTLFSLAALCVYVSGRIELDAGRTRGARLRLLLAFPLLLVAGVLGKENAVVVPLLCAVIELGVFTRTPRNTAVRLFFLLFLVLPGIAAVVLGLLYPQSWLGAYDERTFTLVERLLTQGRALIDYAGQILLPNASRMGVYVDDFAVSTSLLTPLATLPAWIALATLSAAAWWMRTRAPMVFVGWFFFLAAHSVESTILPLELYFEHRNYLPSVGLLLALVAGGAWAFEAGVRSTRVRRTAIIVICSGFAAVLALSTLDRALVWQSKERLAINAVEHHPTSLRANLDYASVMLDAGQPANSVAAMQRLSNSPLPNNRMIGHLGMATIDCLHGGKSDPRSLQNAIANAGPVMRLEDFQAFGLLARVSDDRGCDGITPGMLADAMVAALEAASQTPDTRQPKWRLRMIAARQYARATRLPEALEQARLSWQPTADVGVGSVLVQILAMMGRSDDAERVLQEMEQRLARTDTTGRGDVQRLRESVKNSAAKPPAGTTGNDDAN